MAGNTAFIAGKRCLVLEDEFLIALDIKQTLESAGASVTCIGEADAALATLRGGAPFDVAVLDVKLSGAGRDSMGVAALLTEQGTPFVFLTGLRADDLPAQSFPDAPVVEKQYQVEALLVVLRQALAG